MKKRNIFLGVILAFSLTSCFDMDKMPEGVLSTAQPFSSTGEMRNYLDMFYQITACGDKTSVPVVVVTVLPVLI